MKEQLRKIFSLIVVFAILLCSLSVSSFAQVTLINSDMTASSWSWASYSATPSLTYTASSDRNQFSMTSSTALTVRLTSIATSDVYLNHSYKLSFDIWGHFEDYNFSVVLVTKEDLNTESTHYLCNVTTNLALSDNTYTTVTVDFVPSYFVGSINSMSLDFVFNRVNGATNTRNLYIKNLSLVDTNSNASFWNQLWQKLTDMTTSLINKLNQLSLNIGTYINGLWTNLQTAFSNLTSSVGQFFVDLGDDIEEFFDTITDYILYFQHPVDLDEDGIPVDEYGNPVYENPFESPSFFDTIDDWIEDIDDSKSTIESGANAGITAIQNVISPLSSLLQRVPVLLIFVTFALAIIVIKKVIA